MVYECGGYFKYPYIDEDGKHTEEYIKEIVILESDREYDYFGE
tara:strand:+ start:136 stop:264 length:129 start_codon:yes stop_codon:yes gene_type:complete